ncbi:mannosyltransferase [Poritiphilus flavus]|uniref:Mannosyltransferase n=1 Tax=Poritiphilus flavus TaxID=2697053 RepID=A0A6L9EDK1_9FLAO|nr:mannosyltransferase [Poritiphilus flavus]NAS12776.1 mannosyltransferase [Poritiphilus flavus]
MQNRILIFWKLHRLSMVLALASGLLYAVFAYDLVRTEFMKMIGLFAVLFFFCFKLIQFQKWNFRFLLLVGILFRLVFLLAIPNLSQDFYRFIWDGELLGIGVNPYLFLPDELISDPEFLLANADALHSGMGELSARHYSNYPPLNQFFFYICTLLGGKTILGTVIAMRSLIILADVGIFFFGRQLLKHLNRSPHLIFWYFLNPLVIIELTGNLHFEGVMLFFFVWALHLLSVKQWAWAAVVYALSISIKLVPLIFLPLFLKHFPWKRSFLFYGIIGLVILLTFVPFYDPAFLANYSDTITLWFSNFEFNAGIYNAVKKVGLQFEAKPWELIKSYGKVTPLLVILTVLIISFLRKNQKLQILITSMLFVLALHFFLSATVHPWYIIFLIVLAIFTEFRFPIFWSAVIILSYSAYSNPDFRENLGLLFIEYFVVFGILLYEIIRLRGQKLLFRKN